MTLVREEQMSKNVPDSGPVFDSMMQEIDDALAREDVAIHARPIRAVMAVGQRHRISISLVDYVPPGAPEELHRHATLTRNIHRWYERHYGDRIKIDLSLGSIAVSIGDDLYVMKIPLVYGTVAFHISPIFAQTAKMVSKGPMACNVLQLVQSLTPAKAAILSDDALAQIWNQFLVGLRATEIFEANRNHELIRIARGDIQTAVSTLLSPTKRFNDSKWATLQGAEKVLKAAIALEGGKFKFTHQLGELCKQLHALGITFDWTGLVEQIQCEPAIRYDQTTCTRAEAFQAHQASLRLVCSLAEAGGKFRSRRKKSA